MNFPLSLRLVSLLGLSASSAFAASGTWANETVTTTDANWSTPGNWNGGVVAGSTDLATSNADSAAFPSAAANENPVLDASYRVGQLTIDNTQADYSLGTSVSSNLLILSNAGVPSQLVVTGGGTTTISPELRSAVTTPVWNTGAASVTVAGRVSFSVTGDNTWTLTNTVPVTISGDMSGLTGLATNVLVNGAGSLNVTGNFTNSAGSNLSLSSGANFSGTVTLSGTNTFSAAGNWRSGTLALASNGARASNTVLGTTSSSAGLAAVVITGPFTYTGTFTEAATAANPRILLGGTNTSGISTFSGNVGMTNTSRSGGWEFSAASGGTTVFSGTISGGNAGDSANKVGAGTVRFTLASGNTYTGGTTVTAGRLEISNSTGSGLGTGPVAVNGGTTATLGGTGIATGATTVTNASRLAPGVNTTGTNGNFGGVGTLTLGSTGGLTLTSANLDFDLGTSAASGHDLLNTAALTLGSSIAFNFTLTGATLELGNPYTLIATSGVNTVSGFNPANMTANFVNSTDYTAAFSVDPTSNDLVVTMSTVPEPASALLGLGGLALVATRRQRGRSAPAA